MVPVVDLLNNYDCVIGSASDDFFVRINPHLQSLIFPGIIVFCR